MIMIENLNVELLKFKKPNQLNLNDNNNVNETDEI